MSEKLTRREALRAAAATGAASGLVGAASADGHSNGRSDGGPPKRIVGTTGERGSRAARDQADRVKRSLEFGDIGQAVAGRFSDKAAERLRKRDDVRYVEDNGEMRALEQTVPYGISKVDADLAIDNGDTGDGVSVAVVDTGIDAQHEDLQGNLGTGYAVVNCSTNGGCVFGGGNDIGECLEPWDDDNDHGSHCAGTVGAIDNSTGVLGVAPDVTLHAVKVLDRCGSGSYDDIAEGIRWSADRGHEVQSMSLGGDDSSAVRDAVQYAADRNVVMVAAAGNDGPCSDCVGYPAAYSEVIAVSATDRNDDLADFSSTGPEVELAAPGVDVESTVPRSSYDVFSGTSMACPHVSGGAAQVVAGGTTDRQEVRQQLKNAAVDIGLSDNEQGAGRLDVDDALGSSGGGNSAPTVDSLLTSEVETDDSDAEFDVDWAVSDADGNLDSVDLTLTDDTASESEDTATVGVSGDTASGTTRLVAAGDDGSGNSYTVELVVTDADGASGSDTAAVSEAESTDSAPVIDTFAVTDNSNPNWSRHTVDWAVSDADGDLAEVTSEQLEGGTVVDSVTSTVGGGSASGVHELESRRTSVDEIRLTVVDAAGNTTTASKNV